MDQPPAIIAEYQASAPDYSTIDPNDIVSLMQALARGTSSTEEARKIMDGYGLYDARQLWRLVWNLEIARRAVALRLKDPAAKIPDDWQPL